ncbi:hypothetical protein BUALT_Bualt10G0112500 [Buddleja alternifolia]|uniref:Uncharacterized protein n=1 Tax=Buddleja alternifolia TaxID=168488 RepID=A0AAV6X544_9LAMI|nr:hypothetical protein BUALT_Bualt10G0112500 [Buddleja alternifolia]
MAHISDIKLIRTDTTLDLSQKAEKGMLNLELDFSIYTCSVLLVSSALDVGLKPLAHISNIKLIRTDTTFDLSQKAEKGMPNLEFDFSIYSFSSMYSPWFPMWDLMRLVWRHKSKRKWMSYMTYA